MHHSTNWTTILTILTKLQFSYNQPGNQLTYADVLVAHIITWICEEAGPELLLTMPRLVDLQNNVISLPSVSAFIKSIHYFPLGDEKYVQQVGAVIGYWLCICLVSGLVDIWFAEIGFVCITV